jgi:hypothetical protein
MNSNVMLSHVEMRNDELNNLVEEVKETVATEEFVRKFTSADLWQIERNRKTAAGYTRKWNLN